MAFPRCHRFWAFLGCTATLPSLATHLVNNHGGLQGSPIMYWHNSNASPGAPTLWATPNNLRDICPAFRFFTFAYYRVRNVEHGDGPFAWSQLHCKGWASIKLL